MNRVLTFSLSIAVPLVVFATGTLMPRESTRAAIKTLVSGERGQPGRMTIGSDEFGTFGNWHGRAAFAPDSGTRSRGWMSHGTLMLIDGNDFQWLAHATDHRGVKPALSDRNVVSDVVNDTQTTRTSSFLVDLVDMAVDLVQETPASGYNFVQSYTFTNTGGEPLSLSTVWFNDQDLEFEQTFADNRVGFVPGDVPRVYFIDESDVAGAGDPGIDDRDRRISVATKMGNGITFDGYLGVKPRGRAGGAGDLPMYLQNSPGILEQDLNTIQELRLSRRDTEPNGVDLDTDGDGLVDSEGDVAAAMQFSMDIPVGGSASLAFDYIGGNLSNAFFDLAEDVKELQAGDADQDFDFDQLDLVQVQIAAKYLTRQPATWGEGDWNGAPGGEQGNPPAGNSFFDQLDIISALAPGHYLTGPYAAIKEGGTQGDEQTSLVYHAGTGELMVDSPASKHLTSINVTSAASKFVGDKPAVLDGAFDNFAADNIFKATFGGSFGDISFGNVLPAELSQADVAADLTAVGSLAGGGDLGDVDLVYVPEPSTFFMTTLATISMLVYVARHRLRLAD